MKKRFALSLCLCLLLTSCSWNPSGNPDDTAESTEPAVTETAVSGTETAASATETAVSGTETAVSTAASATSAASAGTASVSTAAGTVKTETDKSSGSGSSGDSGSSGGSGAGRDTGSGGSAGTVTQPAVTEKPAQKPSSVVLLEETPLPSAVSETLNACISSMRTSDLDRFMANSNRFDEIEMYRLIFGEDEDSEESLREETEDLEDEFRELAEYRFEVIFTAHRPEFADLLNEALDELRAELGDESDIPKDKQEQIVSFFEGVTDCYTAEMTMTDADGESEVIGLPILCQNGKWIVDMFIYDTIDFDITRDDIKYSLVYCAQDCLESFETALKYVKNEGLSTDALEGRDFTWKGEKLKSNTKPENNDPMQLLQYCVHKDALDLEQFEEVKFRLENGKCYAFAGRFSDGKCVSAPTETERIIYTSLDEAFEAAKAIASKKK